MDNTTSDANPSFFVNVVNVVPSNFVTPPPKVPNQILPLSSSNNE